MTPSNKPLVKNHPHSDNPVVLNFHSMSSYLLCPFLFTLTDVDFKGDCNFVCAQLHEPLHSNRDTFSHFTQFPSKMPHTGRLSLHPTCTDRYLIGTFVTNRQLKHLWL
jgi:hypothetical protein